MGTLSDDNSFIHVEISDASNTMKTFAVPDSGNRCQSLMSEELFYALNPFAKLDRISTQVHGAGREVLSVAGVPTKPMTLKLQDPITLSYFTFATTPIVIRGLAVPFLLSKQDLKQLGANIDCANETVRISPSNDAYINMPLVEMPQETFQVLAASRISVKPGEERLIPVCVAGADEEDHVYMEPNPDFQQRSALAAPNAISAVRKGRAVFAVTNWSPITITIHKGTVVASGHRYGEEPSDKVSAAYALTVTEKLGPITSETPIKLDQKQLHDRLVSDLRLNSPDCILTETEKEEIIHLFSAYRDCLALSPTDIGAVKGFEFSIDTNGASPIRCRNRPIPPNLKPELKEQLLKWLSQGVIEPAGPHCQWAFPLVPVRKKNGTWRFAIDYRRLNAVTKKDARPVASMDEKIRSLKGRRGQSMRYMITMDLSEAYHHLAIRKEDQEKTSVTTPFGLFKFRRMGFGLAAAPQAFHTVIQALEEKLEAQDPDELSSFVLAYFDDILVAGEDFRSLYDKLHAFLDVVRDMGLRINPSKCNVASRKTRYLGHLVGEHGISPDPNLVSTVRDMQPPTNVSEVRALHGLLSYFRKFIRNFSKRTYNITRLLSERNEFNWTPQCTEELEDMKAVLLSSPILSHPDFSPEAHPFVLSVDTSGRGIGATLTQEQTWINPDTNQQETKEFVVAYGSRKLTSGERAYSAYKLELVGLLTACEHFRWFLLGKRFRVRTDHAALQWLRSTTTKEMPSVVHRWKSMLEAYDFEIVHCPASRMTAADGLSRMRQNGMGNMDEPMTLHEDVWPSDPSPEEAQTTSDDFWLPIMKRRNHATPQVNMVFALTRHQAKFMQQHPYQDLMSLGDMLAPDDDINAPKLQKNTDSPKVNPSPPVQEAEEAANGGRAPQSNFENHFRENLIIKQKEDPGINGIRRLMKTGRWPKTDPQYNEETEKVPENARDDYLTLLKKSKNGKAFRKTNDDVVEIHMEKGNRWLPLMPESLFLKSLQAIHHGPGTQHMGADRTKVACLQYWYIPRLQNRVYDYVKHCVPCQEGKRLPCNESPGLGHTSSALTIPGKTWSLDLSVMPLGTGRFQYLLVCLEPVSQFVEAYPLRNKKANTIAKILRDELIPRYGFNLTLMCDRGKEFMNNAVQDIVAENRGTIHFTTANHSQSNPVERMIKEFNNQFRILSKDRQLGPEKWPDLVKDVLINLRHAPDAVTGTSPFFKLTGEHSHTAATAWFGSDPVIDLPVLKLSDHPEEDMTQDVADVIEEDDEGLVCKTQDGSTIRYHKMQIENEEPALVRTVSSVAPIQDEHQVAIALRNQKSQSDHDRNQQNYMKGKTKFAPQLRELVDWKSPVDEESPNNRKMKTFWTGPFLVESMPNPFTAIIIPFNLSTRKLDVKKKKQVAIAQLKPTLRVAQAARPSADFQPDWIINNNM